MNRTLLIKSFEAVKRNATEARVMVFGLIAGFRRVRRSSAESTTG